MTVHLMNHNMMLTPCCCFSFGQMNQSIPYQKEAMTIVQQVLKNVENEYKYLKANGNSISHVSSMLCKKAQIFIVRMNCSRRAMAALEKGYVMEPLSLQKDPGLRVLFDVLENEVERKLGLSGGGKVMSSVLAPNATPAEIIAQMTATNKKIAEVIEKIEQNTAMVEQNQKGNSKCIAQYAKASNKVKKESKNKPASSNQVVDLMDELKKSMQDQMAAMKEELSGKK
jgi:hypothetical protein